MNSKNIFKSIFVIFAIFLVMNTVFATYTTKGSMPDMARSKMKKNMTNINIKNIKVIPSTSGYDKCYIKIEFEEEIPSNLSLYPHFLISASLEDKTIYPKTMDKFVSDNRQSSSGTSSVISNANTNIYLQKYANHLKIYEIGVPHNDICSGKTIDVYIFVPNHKYNFISGTYDNVYTFTRYITGYDVSGVIETVTIDSYDLKDDSKYLYDVLKGKPRASIYPFQYYYNVDYAYGVPVTVTGASPDSTTPKTSKVVDLSYSRINVKSDLKVDGFSDLSINRPIELVDDGLCTNPDYPYHLRMSGGTTGIGSRDTYMGFVGPNTFAANKKDILKFIYNYESDPSNYAKIEYLDAITNPGQSLIKADKFNLLKNGLNQVFCLSKVFAGKKLNIFVWQSKDTGNKIDFGLGTNNKKWVIPENDFNNTGYLDKINFEFGYVIELAIPSNPFSGSTPSSTGGSSTPPSNETPSDPSDVGLDTTEEQVEPVAPQQVNLDFTVYSSIQDISYSTTTATQYKARKVNDQEAYLIDYRNNKKEISVNLSSLNYTRPVYAILATPDQSDKIYGYLANIKSTGEFKDYTLQTNFTVNSNTLATSPVTMKYTMGSDKTFKFSIDPNVNDKFVLIFMQLSDDGSLINLTYTNLYNLDHNAQSIYQLCEINRNIVNFYCKGYDCKVPGSCIDRWDFDPSKLDGVSGIPVDAIPGTPTTPKPPVETPPATPTPPVSQDTTLAKGADGCYTTNPETLAKIRSTNIGISKTIFPNRRTTSSIVSPGTADGTDDDPSITMEQINKIANMNTAKFSPDPIFKDSANSIYNLALLYNVDPIYALAIFRQEKSMYNTKAGNWGTDLTTTSKNPTSIMVSNNGYCACGGSRYTNNYCRYPTLDAGFEAFFININSRLYKGKTLTVVGSYWRYGISTNTTYGNSIKGHMDWIYNNAK